MSPPVTAARRVLGEVFGYAAFRPGQEAAIGALLAGRNVLAVRRWIDKASALAEGGWRDLVPRHGTEH